VLNPLYTKAAPADKALKILISPSAAPLLDDANTVKGTDQGLLRRR